MPAGQWTINGVAIPPSWVQTLCRRKGVLAALENPGPRHRNVAADPGGAEGSCPSPRTIISALAPLSVANQMTELLQAPIART